MSAYQSEILKFGACKKKEQDETLVQMKKLLKENTIERSKDAIAFLKIHFSLQIVRLLRKQIAQYLWDQARRKPRDPKSKQRLKNKRVFIAYRVI
jgi:hypothetical protein